MYNFALRVANLLDAATGTAEFSEMLAHHKESAESVFGEYDADKIKEACVALVETGVQDASFLEILNPKDLDASTAEMLIEMATRGRCERDHLKECEGHRRYLVAIYSGLLPALCGVDLRAVRRQHDAVHELVQSALDFIGVVTAQNDASDHLKVVWANMMLDQRNLMSLAGALNEVPKENRQSVLHAVAQIAVNAEEWPQPEDFQEMVKQVSLDL